MIDAARRSPSAGHTQGVEFLLLHGEGCAEYWNVTLTPERRREFPWPGLLRAPALVLPFSDPGRYVDRYGEPDKARTGLGAGADAWPVPYWHVDAAFAAMTLQLLAVERGLGTLFFGMFDHEEAVKSHFGVPAQHRGVGVVALGWPADAQRTSRSLSRGRRDLDEVLHRNRW